MHVFCSVFLLKSGCSNILVSGQKEREEYIFWMKLLAALVYGIVVLEMQTSLSVMIIAENCFLSK